MALPTEDTVLQSRNKLKSEMAMLLGGRAAEEIVFNDITSGAANDLERVTRVARNMVTRLGMSPDLGPLVYGQKEELIFLGREISEQRDYSETIAEKIDDAVRDLVDEAYDRARHILHEYRAQLDAIAHRLIEAETLDADEFAAAFGSPVEPKVSGTPVPVPQSAPA